MLYRELCHTKSRHEHRQFVYQNAVHVLCATIYTVPCFKFKNTEHIGIIKYSTLHITEYRRKAGDSKTTAVQLRSQKDHEIQSTHTPFCPPPRRTVTTSRSTSSIAAVHCVCQAQCNERGLQLQGCGASFYVILRLVQARDRV